MSILSLLVSTTYAQSPVTVVNEDEIAQVRGPGVFLPEDKYRLYVSESRQLQSCFQGLDELAEKHRLARESMQAHINELKEINTKSDKNFNELARANNKLVRQHVSLKRQRDLLLGSTVVLATVGIVAIVIQ